MKKIACKKGLVAALCLPLLGGAASSFAASVDPLMGSVDYVGFNFAPRGWATCDGQLLPISSNSALFSLLGTTFGGDGRTTFALPDMRGRVPLHQGQGPGLQVYKIGQRGGTETTQLSIANMPAHKHDVAATSTSSLKSVTAAGNAIGPGGNSIARSSVSGSQNFSSTAPSADMNAGSVATTTTVTEQPAGGGQAFSNMQPYTVLNCVIALQGSFPSRN